MRPGQIIFAHPGGGGAAMAVMLNPLGDARVEPVGRVGDEEMWAYGEGIGV